LFYRVFDAAQCERHVNGMGNRAVMGSKRKSFARLRHQIKRRMTDNLQRCIADLEESIRKNPSSSTIQREQLEELKEQGRKDESNGM
jgi:hypothetical protein